MPEKSDLSRRLILSLSGVALLLSPFVLLYLAMMGAIHFISIPLQFLFGWIVYPIKTVPVLVVQPGHVAVFAVSLLLFVLLSHRFLVWLKACRNSVGADAGRPWPFRKTLVLCGLLMVFFLAGIALIGSFHQTAWLANFNKPWVMEMKSRKEYGMKISEELAWKASHQNWNTTQVQAAVQKVNLDSDGFVRLMAALDKNGEWRAIVSHYQELDLRRIWASPRYKDDWGPRDGSVEEILQHYAKDTYTPKTDAEKPGALR